MTENAKPAIPSSLSPLLTSAYHAADRAWTGFQGFLVFQSFLAVVWANLTNGETIDRWLVGVIVSAVAILACFQWSMLGTRMWHYHLEYAHRLRKLTSTFQVEREGVGATVWREVDEAIDAQWHNRSLRWFKDLSGNHWILFLAPLMLAGMHLAMLVWLLWQQSTWGKYVAIAAAVIVGIGFAAVWLFCKPILEKDFYAQLREERG